MTKCLSLAADLRTYQFAAFFNAFAAAVLFDQSSEVLTTISGRREKASSENNIRKVSGGK